MCDDYWDTADAQVVCRQLGYPTNNAIAFTGAKFSQGSGPIYMDNVLCAGTESSLFSCRYTSYYHDCSHLKDAGVKCASSKYTKIIVC